MKWDCETEVEISDPSEHIVMKIFLPLLAYLEHGTLMLKILCVS